MFEALDIIFFFAFVGIFMLLSAIFAGLAWLLFGATVAIWVGAVGMIFGILWTSYCYWEQS